MRHWAHNTVKTKQFSRSLTLLYVSLKRGKYFGNFSRLAYVQPHPLKALGEILWMIWDYKYILKNTHYSLIFQGRPMFSRINGKLSVRRSEWYCWTWAISWKIIYIRSTSILFPHPKQVRTPQKRCSVFTVNLTYKPTLYHRQVQCCLCPAYSISLRSVIK